jgi:hypothetical protein
VAEGGGDDCFLGVEALVSKRMESKRRRRRKKVARSSRNSITTIWSQLFLTCVLSDGKFIWLMDWRGNGFYNV